MKAEAAVALALGKVSYQSVEVPEPGPEDIVIRVTHSWISNGTEGSFVRGERIAGDTPRKDSDPLPFPHVPGYQKVGVVESIGSAAEANGLVVGDAVFATVSRVNGMFYPYAGHVSPAVTHRSQVWKLPADIDPMAASGLVLTQVGFNAAMRPTVQQGDRCVVIGDGMVGHWSAQTLKYRGANVCLIGKHDSRLALFPAEADDLRINVTRQAALPAIREWAPGGIQAIVDTTGPVSFVESLLPALHRNSHISSAGFYGHDGQIDIQKLRDYELTLHAPSGWSRQRIDTTLQLLQCGSLSTLPLITHHFQAENAADAFDLILTRREPVLGVVLHWKQT